MGARDQGRPAPSLAWAVAVVLAAGCAVRPEPKAPRATVAVPPRHLVLARDRLRKVRAAGDEGVIIGIAGGASRLLPLATRAPRTALPAGENAAPTPGAPSAPAGITMSPAAELPAGASPALVTAAFAAAVTLGLPVPAGVARAPAAGQASGAELAVGILAAYLGSTPRNPVRGAITFDGRVVKGTAVRPLAVAYQRATGERLPSPEPVAPADLDSRTEQELLEQMRALRADMAADYADLLRIDTAGRMPTALARMARRALTETRAAERGAQSGSVLGAWLRLRRARRDARVAATAFRILLAIRDGDPGGALEQLAAEGERVRAAVEGADAPATAGLEGQLLAASAALSRGRARGWLSAGQRWLAEASEYLRSETAGGAPFGFDRADPLADHLVPVLAALGRAEANAEDAAMVAGLRLRALVPAAPEGALDDLARTLARLPVRSPVDVAGDWPARAAAAQGPGSPDDDGPALATAGAADRLGHAMAWLAPPVEVATDEGVRVTDLHVRRLAHRAEVVLGAVPAEVHWRLLMAESLIGGSEVDRRRAVADLDRAALIAIAAVELGLAPPSTAPSVTAQPAPTPAQPAARQPAPAPAPAQPTSTPTPTPAPAQTASEPPADPAPAPPADPAPVPDSAD